MPAATPWCGLKANSRPAFPYLSARPALAKNSSKCAVSGYPGTCDRLRPVSCLARPNWTFFSRTTSSIRIQLRYGEWRPAAPRAPSKAGHRGIRKLVTFPHNPVACNSQTQTTTTTKTFRIVLILEAMGMYRLIRYNATPTIINTTTRFSKGIFLLLQIQDGAIRCPMLRRRVSSPWKAMGARAWLVEEPGLALLWGSQQTTGARHMIECGQICLPPRFHGLPAAQSMETAPWRSRLSKPCEINATVAEPRPPGSGFPKTVKHPAPS